VFSRFPVAAIAIASYDPALDASDLVQAAAFQLLVRIASSSVGRNSLKSSFLLAALALPDESIKLLGLLPDAVRDPLLVPTAGRRCGLLDELPKVASQDRNAIVEFRQR
jgi:hypothetical protein